MKLLCNAKINLTLNITGKREDGYHLLDSVMQSVNLADEITVIPSDKITVDCSNQLFSGEKNIAYTAAVRFFEYTKISGGAKIYINKNIPDAAGLGGGSADAAGVILALNKIYSANLSEEELLNIALKCGADVPFCIKGGTKRVSGIGEILEDAPPFSNCFIVIAKNGTKPSTAEMYKRFDEIDNPKFADNDAFLKSLECENTEEALRFAENSFEAVTGLYGIDEIISSTNPIKVSLSGSGPSVFAVYTDERNANSALALLNEKNITAIKTTPADKSVIFE